MPDTERATGNAGQVTGPHGMHFVAVSAGTSLMGSPGTETGRSSDETLHEVTLTRDFQIASAPVTQAQWATVMGGNPSRFKDSGPDAPVEWVSWDDAVAWCRKVSETDSGWSYRLPSEAEWEYACRAGRTASYNVNNSAYLDDLGWYEANSHGKTHPAGQKRANGWGLHDCHGNVFEWCQDLYGAYPAESVADPSGPRDGDYRVIRGGCWGNGAANCRSASRHKSMPGDRSFCIGFRPVRVRGTSVGAPSSQPKPPGELPVVHSKPLDIAPVEKTIANRPLPPREEPLNPVASSDISVSPREDSSIPRSVAPTVVTRQSAVDEEHDEAPRQGPAKILMLLVLFLGLGAALFVFKEQASGIFRDIVRWVGSFSAR